jgi:NTP pyrophosphatase (non-canonical NTP hydrolase)
VNQQIAEQIAAHLREQFPDTPNRQVLALAEETGEFIGAYRRWSGQARRTGSFDDVRAELADVVISAWVVAADLDIDMDAAIAEELAVVFERGWREDQRA